MEGGTANHNRKSWAKKTKERMDGRRRERESWEVKKH